MAIYRFPVLVWRDPAGYYTARWVEERGGGSIDAVLSTDEVDHWVKGTAAVADTREKALRQLRDFLAWRVEKNPWMDEPDVLEPALVWVRVMVRPQYRTGHKVLPCDEPIRLLVPCVTGRRDGGLLVCSIPTLDIVFDYYDAKATARLVRHYVQATLGGVTPRQLSRLLPPPAAALDELIVRSHTVRHRRQRAETLQLPTLTAVAEPLGRRGFLRREGRCWERKIELRVLQSSLGTERSNLLLLGGSGVGKTALLGEAIRRVERADRQEEGDEARQTRFWLTSGSRLVSGMRYVGQWQERCEELIDELSSIGGTLCFEKIVDLLLRGGAGPGDSIAAFLRSYLEDGELHAIGEATPEELDACRRLLPGFTDAFQIIRVPGFSRKQALAVLDRQATELKVTVGMQTGERTTDAVYPCGQRTHPARP